MMESSERAQDSVITGSVIDTQHNDQISPENDVELSSIVEPVTPVDVIVQRQIRDVLQLQNATVAYLHESVSGQESFIREHLVSKEEHLSKLKDVEKSVNENFVSRELYEELVQKLEQEQHSHAETKLRLIEVTDKLDFTLGEIEVLGKQLNNEKEAFQQIVDSLRSQVAKGDNWNKKLEGDYSVCQKQCQDLNARLLSREATIEGLEQRLAVQQIKCEHKIEEIEVERQQDQYVARMLEQQKNGRNGRAKNKCVNTTSCVGRKIKR